MIRSGDIPVNDSFSNVDAVATADELRRIADRVECGKAFHNNVVSLIRLSDGSVYSLAVEVPRSAIERVLNYD